MIGSFRSAIAVCILTTGLAASAEAYNRAAAVEYARSWSDDSGVLQEGIYNEGVYDRFGSDCANFVSQCLTAGGIRFRSSLMAADNLTPAQANELETGFLTFAIHSDEKKYSRVLVRANELPRSLLHSRHNSIGTPYLSLDLRR
jgi:hypothetical protein